MQTRLIVFFSLLFLLGFLNAFSQQTNITIQVGNNKKEPKTIARNEKAMRNFHKQHKGVANETWYTTKNGFRAEFVSNNRQATSVYGKRGSWLYTIVSYNTDNLTTDLISLIKTQYDKYSILVVKKIESPAADPFFSSVHSPYYFLQEANGVVSKMAVRRGPV